MQELFALAKAVNYSASIASAGVVFDVDDESYQHMTIQELAWLMDLTGNIHTEIDKLAKKLAVVYDELRIRHIPTKMDEESIDSIRIADLGLLMLTDDLRVRVIDQERQFEWLEETLNGDLIRPTVNAGSLKALLRRRLVAAEVVPTDIFDVKPFTRASIKKR